MVGQTNCLSRLSNEFPKNRPGILQLGLFGGARGAETAVNSFSRNSGFSGGSAGPCERSLRIVNAGVQGSLGSP